MDSVVTRHNEVLFNTITNHNRKREYCTPEDPEEQLSFFKKLDAESSPEFILGEESDYDATEYQKQPSFRSRKTHKLIWGALAHIRSEEDVRETSRTAKTMLAEENVKSIKSKIQHSEKMLQDAFIEFYRGLNLLKNYRSLNRLAFKKILKKYDKVTHKGASTVYMKTVTDSYFLTSDKVSYLLDWVESMFADFFTDGDKHRARNMLKPRTTKTRHRISFFLGLFTGCCLALAVGYVAILHVLSSSLTPEEGAARRRRYLHSVFPIFSMTALLALHLHMYGWNLYCWRRTRINYAFIFEFAPGTELDYRRVLLVSTGITMLFGVGLVGHLAATLNDSPATDFIPLGVLVILLLMLIDPFDHFYRSSRLFFLRTLSRLMSAPFVKVLLVDFFVGDQLTSQVPLLRNIVYAACFYFGGWFTKGNGDVCNSNPEIILASYVMSILPFWWRMMQCARRYVDDKEMTHVASFLKYLSAMIAIIMKIFYGRKGTLAWMMSYIAASTIATIYQTYWDLVVDWGLLNRNSQNPWLRDQLILENKNYVYFLSIAFNVIFRLAWVVSVTRFEFGGLDPRLTDSILAAMEIVRRGHWNFYRIENEHLNNVGNYRAVKTVPLPFAYDLKGDL